MKLPSVMLQQFWWQTLFGYSGASGPESRQTKLASTFGVETALAKVAREATVSCLRVTRVDDLRPAGIGLVSRPALIGYDPREGSPQ